MLKPQILAAHLGIILCCTSLVCEANPVETTAKNPDSNNVQGSASPAVKTAARYGNRDFFYFGYNYYQVSEFPLPWFAANYECKRRNMALVSVESREEDDYIRQHLFVNYPNEHFWMSGNDMYQEGFYTWDSTGTAVGPYRNWSPNHPVSSVSINCMFYDRSSDLRWSSSVCSQNIRFICKR